MFISLNALTRFGAQRSSASYVIISAPSSTLRAGTMSSSASELDVTNNQQSGTAALTEEEASRYDRQMRLWGLEAQQRSGHSALYLSVARTLTPQCSHQDEKRYYPGGTPARCSHGSNQEYGVGWNREACYCGWRRCSRRRPWGRLLLQR